MRVSRELCEYRPGSRRKGRPAGAVRGVSIRVRAILPADSYINLQVFNFETHLNKKT